MTTGPSDSELAKQYWRRQAQNLRAQLEEANPSLKPIGGIGSRPWKPVEDAAIAGASSRAFLTAFGNGGSEPSVMPKASPSEVAAAKGRIIEAMVQAGRDTKYIEDAMQKISPHLDVFALSADPAVQSVLLQRIMNNNSAQNLGMRDLIDAMKLVQDLRNTSQQTPQSDPASLMSAAGNLFKTGVETARNRNDGMAVSELLAMQQQSHDKMLQAQQEHFREIRELQHQQQSSNSPLDLLRQVQETKDIVEKITGKESEALATRRLELDHEKWKTQTEADTERKKAANQTELVKTAFGNLGKFLETPIVREAGRSVGQALTKRVPSAGAVVNAVTGAPGEAARSELRSPPTQLPWSFTCSTCKFSRNFSQFELAKIQQSPERRYICDGCGAAYQLPPEESGAQP